MIATAAHRPAPAAHLANWLQAFLTGQPTPAPAVKPAAYETVDLADPFWVESQFPEHALAEACPA